MEAVIYRYTNAGESLGVLAYDAATHEEDLDNSDMLTVTASEEPSKRDRLVWQDAGGVWHEHMVDSAKRVHSNGRPKSEITCSNSICELFGTPAAGTKLTGSVQALLAHLLSGTRWTCGTCSDFGNVELEVWHKNVRQCIRELCELTGGELETTVTVGSSGVTSRSARIVSERGSSSVMRQFTYGRNVSGITREVGADEVYTAIIGYGAVIGDSREDYAERYAVTVESDLDLSKWGIPDGSGGFTNNWTTYTDSQCDDLAFLRQQCQRQLDVLSKPLIRYEFDITEVDEGLWSDVRLGNRVMCVDELFDPPLELTERVSHVSRRLKGRMSCKVAVGDRANPLVEQFKATEKTTQSSSGNSVRSYSYTPVTTDSGSYVIGGGGGGDGWTHQVNGVTQATGTINFVTSGGSSSTQKTPDTWGGVDKAKNKKGWYKSDYDKSWGGTGGGKF